MYERCHGQRMASWEVWALRVLLSLMDTFWEPDVGGYFLSEGSHTVVAKGGLDLGIEGRTPPKAAARPSQFGGSFPCNLRWGVISVRGLNRAALIKAVMMKLCSFYLEHWRPA